MHGKVQRGSVRSLGRGCNQHMRPVLPLSLPQALALAGDNSSHPASSITTSGSNDSFFKDRRKISVGDCALFKPPKDSPPLVGVIRWLALNKESNLHLGVNWLYRSSELKLGKGTLVDSAPNEVFYTFQKDEIPASSLLHPCKVTFLPRGVELPAGTSSFVCRRIYNSANKSLSWLTDRNYINDQQEEVDRLLFKSRTEMHSARSPKQTNGRISTSQLKPASDSGQNSGNSCPAQAKGKKRERGDHGADSVKRGCVTKPDGDSVHCKTESNFKYEIAKITDKGGGVNLEGVEKLVQLMQPDNPEKNLDLGTISMFANVLASTDKVDCLDRFLHLKGLPVLNVWLQDIHKGKIRQGNCTKDGDKSVDEFLLVLLRALDKLPVNLQALQMCSIGRSVNHLRSHKNTEIQRKSRTLVDTWKKRVEAEMISIDAKSSSTQAVSGWPSKSCLPEASHGGIQAPDGAMKSSVTQNPSAKTSSGRSLPGETSIKCATTSPGPVKPGSTPAFGKESQHRNSFRVTPEALQIREDRSSSSNQSHNQKDDKKSSPTGSVTVNKISSSSSGNRKNGGHPGISAAASQKGTSSSKSSLAHRSTALEKLSLSEIKGERPVEGALTEGSSHKIIVNIPNGVASPAQGVSGGSLKDDTMIRSQASSPVCLNKHEQPDRASKIKEVLSGSEGAWSPAVLPDEEQSLTTEVSKRLNEGPVSDQLKSIKLHDSSFSPMNALIESCVKYSEGASSFSREDDVGMNLLASVAAGEISRSDVVSPSDSTERTTAAVDEACSGGETKSKASHEYYTSGVPNQSYNDRCDGEKSVLDGFSGSDSVLCLSKEAPVEFASDRICAPIPTDESNDMAGMTSISKALHISMGKVKHGESNGGIHEEKTTSSDVIDDGDVMVSEEKCHADHLSIGECKPFEVGDCNKFENEVLTSASISQPKLTAAAVKAEFAERSSNKDLQQSECGQKSVSETGGYVKVEEPDNKDAKSYTSKSERLESDQEVERNGGVESHTAAFTCSTSHDPDSNSKVAKLEHQKIGDHLHSESRCPSSVKHEAQVNELTGSRSTSIRLDETNPCEKMKFDLNEGCSDGDDGEYISLSTAVLMISSFPSGDSASITLAPAAVHPSVPPEDLLGSKVELGWKGPAASSAFRPAEPRKVLEMSLTPSNTFCPDASSSKKDRSPFDFDLNVPDERVLEEISYQDSALAVESIPDVASDFMPLRVSGGLDLDLNIADETNDTGYCLPTRHLHEDVKHIHRDFNLNDGPAGDDSSLRQFPINQTVKGGSVASHQSSSGKPMNNQGQSSNFTSWFSPGNTYSTVAIPSVGEHHPYPIFPPGPNHRPFNVAQFNPNVYRGSVLSSSPAVPYPSNTFQFPVFPFGTSFPSPSGTYSFRGPPFPDSPSSGGRNFPHPMNSHYVGPVGTVATQFQRPCVVGLADSSNNGWMDNRRWSRQGPNINSGPGPSEVSSGQNFQALTEEQARMFSVSGGVLKRREPEGSWDNELVRQRHSSWQQ